MDPRKQKQQQHHQRHRDRPQDPRSRERVTHGHASSRAPAQPGPSHHNNRQEELEEEVMVAVKKTPKKSSVAQIPDDRIRGFRWDEPACYALMRACNDHWDVLRGPDSSGPGSNAAKTQTWEDVAAYVNKTSKHYRTAAECKEKVRRYTSESKKKNVNLSHKYSTKTGMGQIPPHEQLLPSEELALQFLGEETCTGISTIEATPIDGKPPPPPARDILEQRRAAKRKMAARHEEEDEEEERIVGMMEPQLKIRRTNPYVPDLDQNVNLPERPRKPRVTSTVSRPPPAVLDEDDEEDVGGQSDITDDRDQSYQPPPSDEEEEGANSSSEEEELEDSQQVEAETGEESMDASMVSESESMVPPSQPTTSNSHRRLFVAPKPVQAAQVIRQPTKDTRRVVIKREPTTPKKTAPVAPEAPRVSTPKTKPARERVVLVNEAGEPVQSSPPKPSTPKPKKQATPAKVYVKPTTTETAKPTTSNSSEGRHQIKKEHGPHTEKRDGNGSVVVSEEYLSRIVHLLEKSNDVKQQQIQAYEKSARDQIEANDRRSKEQIEATDRQSKALTDLLSHLKRQGLRDKETQTDRAWAVSVPHHPNLPHQQPPLLLPYQDIHFMPSAELFKAGVAEPTVAQEATETAPVKAVSVSTEEAEEVVNQRIKDICDAQIRLLIAANQPGPSTSPPPGAVAETIAPTEEQVEPDLLAHTKKDAVNEEEQNEEADDNEKQRLDDNHTGTTTSGADLADVLQATEKGRGKKSRRGRSNKKN